MNIRIYPKNPKLSKKMDSTTNKIISIGYYILLGNILKNLSIDSTEVNYLRWTLLCNPHYNIRDIQLLNGIRATRLSDWDDNIICT